MVTFELDGNAALTNREKRMLTAAKELPVVYDDDSPELTDDMEEAFAAARKAKPHRGQPLTLYVSTADYTAILSQLLDKAVDEYRAIP